MMNCRVCHIELTNDNWNPSTKKVHSYICKMCDAERKRLYYLDHKEEHKQRGKDYYLLNKIKIDEYRRNWRRHNQLGQLNKFGEKIVIRCIKRPHTLICELCNNYVKRTVYHHWDDEHPGRGMWICLKCHNKAEAIEDVAFVLKYNILKENLDGKNNTNRLWRQCLCNKDK